MKIEFSIFIFIFVIPLLTFCTSTSNDNFMEADKYVDMTIGQVIEKLGIPDYMVEKNIDDKYLPTPIEPIYSAYFSETELKQSVTINVARWIQGKTNIIVWLKILEEEWVVFSSLKYNKDPNINI